MSWLIILSFVLAPTYAIKFNLFGLPTDLLMMWVVLVWIIFIGWLIIKKQVSDYLKFKFAIDRKILFFVGLFFLAGLISTFVGGFSRANLGQFIVLILQPISLFFIGGYLFNKNPNAKPLLLNTLYFILALAGLYAILQYFTLVGLSPAWWGNSDEPKRALSFFVHPNFYALWCAPLLAFLIPDVSHHLGVILRAGRPEKSHNEILQLTLQDDANYAWVIAKVIFWIIGVVGLLLSLSRAGWLGLGVAALVYLIVAADKKIRKLALGAVIVMAIVIISVPNLRWRFVLPFYGEKSAVSRLSLWHTGIKGIKESPILGLGLTGFSNQWTTLNTDPGLTDTHNFPHNIFLDFWVETGLLGLISFIGIAWLGLHQGFKNRHDAIKLGVTLFLLALIIQGLIDNPYFKNDLALMFWTILSLVMTI